MIPILSLINTIPRIDTHFFKIHSNSFLPSTPRPKDLFAMDVKNHQSSSEVLCDVSEQRWFLQCEGVSLTPNSEAGGPLLLTCSQLLIQYIRK